MYESQGRRDEAQRLVRESLDVNPDLTADRLASAELNAAFLASDEKARIREALQRAGLP
jgi:hypothetical protein